MSEAMRKCSLTFGSLFAGIGGFDIGFIRAGMRCLWQVEIDGFCRSILRERFGVVRLHGDVLEVEPGMLPHVDVICGGFPCQDVSVANTRYGGINGSRTGLWRSMLAWVGVLGPDYVVMENVPAIVNRGWGQVLGAFSEIGYDCQWDIISAEEFGAPIRRERLYAVAFAARKRCVSAHVFDRSITECATQKARQSEWNGVLARSYSDRVRWLPASGIRRVVDGLPSTVDKDRLKALGNAVVPQIAEWIGKRLIALEERRG